MTQEPAEYSVSGVRIADDFRDNLIIDRYDECFVSMRQSKKKHLRSENSEDALSWNVFRSLRQIEPGSWIPSIAKKAFGSALSGNLSDTTVSLWRDVAPPPSLLGSGDEGISEIDVVLQNPEWVWFIEAKYKSDISEGTTTRPQRDQILRNLDVGSYYAGVRPYYFALLYLDDTRSPKGLGTISRYQDFDTVRAALAHRVDRLPDLKGIGLLRWADLVDALGAVRAVSARVDERDCARRALDWLRERGISVAE